MVELTVVMAIIAIIGVIGAPALISARRQFILDSVTQDVISTIRMAQNKAISVQGGKNNNAKIWGAKFSSNDFGLYSYSSVGAESLEEINLKKYPNVDIAGQTLIYFASPFGRAYVCNVAPSEWTVSTRAEKDYVPVCPTAERSIVLNYGNLSRVVTIKVNGDVYAQ